MKKDKEKKSKSNKEELLESTEDAVEKKSKTKEEKTEISLNFKDFISYTLDRRRIIIFTATVCAVIVAILLIIKSAVTWKDDNNEYLDKCDQYETAISAYEDYLKALQNGVEIYADDYDKEQEYINNSVLINLDYENLLTVNTELLLRPVSDEIDLSNVSINDALKLYSDYLYEYANWNAIGDMLGILPRYCVELVGVDVNYEDAIININVYYPDEQISYDITNTLINDAKAKVAEVKIYNGYELVVIEQAADISYSEWLKNKIDSAIGQRDWKKSVYEEAQANVENYTVEGKPEYPEKPRILSKKFVVLNTVLCSLITFLFVVLVYFILYYYIFTKKGIIYSVSEFDRITGLNNLGVIPNVKEINDKSIYEDALLRIKLHMDIFSDTHKILVIDNCDDDRQFLIRKLFSRVTDKSFAYSTELSSNDSLRMLSVCDGVIFVVKREKTMLNEILSNKKFVEDRDKKILGNIIL